MAIEKISFRRGGGQFAVCAWADDVHRHGNHRARIAEGRRHDEGVPLFREVSKLIDVLLRHAELNRLVVAGGLNRFGDLPNPLRGRLRNAQNRGGLPLRLVDLLLLPRFGCFNDLLLLPPSLHWDRNRLGTNTGDRVYQRPRCCQEKIFIY